MARRWFLQAFFFLGALAGVGGCKLKDKLSPETASFSISPPAVQLKANQSQTLLARVTTIGGVQLVDADWEISFPENRPNAGSLSTFVGSSVTFTADPSNLGDAVITATRNGSQATARIAVVAYIPDNSSNIFNIYTTRGLPTGPNILSDINIFPLNLDLQTVTDEYTPEGGEFIRAISVANGGGWLVTLDKPPIMGRSMDLSGFATGHMKFWIRLHAPIGGGLVMQAQVKDATGQTAIVNSAGWSGFSTLDTDWQEVSVNLSTLLNGAPNLNEAAINIPFVIVVANGGPLTFDVDAIRWEK